MKTNKFGHMGILLLAGSFFVPTVHAAGGETLKLSSAETLQGLVQNTMQQMIEGAMQQMLQDSLELQPVQRGMLIRLTEDMPAGLDEHLKRDATGNLPLDNGSPQSRIPASRSRLG